MPCLLATSGGASQVGGQHQVFGLDDPALEAFGDLDLLLGDGVLTGGGFSPFASAIRLVAAVAQSERWVSNGRA